MVNKLYANTPGGDLPKIVKWGCLRIRQEAEWGCLSFLQVKLDAKVAKTYRGNPLLFWLRSC